jgi:PTS system mannitol-specific IIC component
MILGPAAGYVVKKFDDLTGDKIPSGFEMLVQNFSLGIFGILFAIAGYYLIGPFVELFTEILSTATEFIIGKGILPLVSLFIEPAKILFLNNAINHGLFTPMGIEQVQSSGNSIMFLLEANPGSGLGVLLAYWLFSKGTAKNTAPGSLIIHLFGGIHEIYFPYILARPVLIIGPIIGSASAILIYVLFEGGLVAPASPGSIFAIIAMTPKGKHLVVLLGVIVEAFLSFIISAVILKKSKEKEEEILTTTLEKELLTANNYQKEKINKITFACDAGMGSSAMGATRFRKKLAKSGININVTNSSVDDIPNDTDVIVCQQFLSERAKQAAPYSKLIIIENFLDDPNLEMLFTQISQANSYLIATEDQDILPDTSNYIESILKVNNIKTGLKSTSKEEAIQYAGELLVNNGYVKNDYIKAMLQRENEATTYIGSGVAIPHGTAESKKSILKSGIIILQYPEGVTFNDNTANLIIGIAGIGNEHIEILAHLSSVLENEEMLEKLVNTNDPNLIFEMFTL